jgi:hypothetical protein
MKYVIYLKEEICRIGVRTIHLSNRVIGVLAL